MKETRYDLFCVSLSIKEMLIMDLQWFISEVQRTANTEVTSILLLLSS